MGGHPLHDRRPDSPPARVGVSIGDSLASLHGVIGALMSLLRVKTGQGRGQVVDVSLVESVFNLMESLVPEYDLLGHVRDPHRRRAAGHHAVEHVSAPTTAAIVVIAGNSDPIFKRLMQVIGRPDLADDPALAQQRRPRRAGNAMLDAAIAAWTSQRTIDEVLAALERGRSACRAHLLGRRHRRRSALRRPRHDPADASCPAARQVKMPGIVPKLSDTPGAVALAWPDARRHTPTRCWPASASTQSDIARLRREGAVQ